MKQGVKWIYRSLVESPYCIGLCRTEHDFKAEMKRLKVPKRDRPAWITKEFDGSTHYFEKFAGTHELCCLVCIDGAKKRKRWQVDGLLVHEAVHVWRRVKKELNERNPSVEMEAYSIQNIAQRLISANRNARRRA